MQPYINIFGRLIPSYGVMMFAAAVAAWLSLFALIKAKKRISLADGFYVYLIGICGGFIGAVSIRPLMKIFEIPFNWDNFKMMPLGEVFTYLFGEIVFYGGLIGGLIAVFLYCRAFKMQLVEILDLLAPALALAHGVGRLGCFLGGCCYGLEVPRGSMFSVIYPPLSLSAPAGIPLLAVPLIEAGFLACLFIVLCVVYIKSKKAGLTGFIYLVIYAPGRFVLEFFRGDLIRGQYWLFSTSQLISVALFVFAFIYYFLLRKRERCHT